MAVDGWIAEFQLDVFISESPSASATKLPNCNDLDLNLSFVNLFLEAAKIPNNSYFKIISVIALGI